MTLRAALPLVAALALALLASACDDGGNVPNDPRVLRIDAVAEDATYGYATGGPEGLYPYLAPEVRDRCSREQFAQALAGGDQPTGFRGIKEVKFEDEEARVTVIQIAIDHDQDVEWVFVPGPNDTWYLSEVPGLEECGA